MENRKEFVTRFARVFGLFAVLTGGGAAYWLWQRALKLAEEKATEIQMYGKSFSFFVSFAVLGLLLILFGSKVQDYSSSLKDREKKAIDYLIIGLIIAPGIIAYSILRSKLAELGYEF